MQEKAKAGDKIFECRAAQSGTKRKKKSTHFRIGFPKTKIAVERMKKCNREYGPNNGKWCLATDFKSNSRLLQAYCMWTAPDREKHLRTMRDRKNRVGFGWRFGKWNGIKTDKYGICKPDSTFVNPKVADLPQGGMCIPNENHPVSRETLPYRIFNLVKDKPCTGWCLNRKTQGCDCFDGKQTSMFSTANTRLSFRKVIDVVGQVLQVASKLLCGGVPDLGCPWVSNL